MKRALVAIATVVLALAAMLAGCGLAGRRATATPAVTVSSTEPPLARPTVYDTTSQPYADYAIVGFDAARGAQTLHYGAGEAGTTGFSSTPSLADGMAYAGGYLIPTPCSGPSSSCPPVQHFLYALDLGAGAMRWQAPMDGPVDEPPTVAGGVVYAATAPYGRSVYAFDAHTGAQRWRFQADVGMEGPPVVVDNVVYVSSGYVYALRADTGAQVWRSTAVVGMDTSTPAVADGAVYVGHLSGVVTALRATDGTVLWQTPTGHPIDAGAVAAGGMVYIGSRLTQAGQQAFLFALDAHTGAIRWRYQVGGGIVSTPAVAAGLVYVGAADNYLDALDAATGALRWRFEATGFLAFDPQAQQWAQQNNGVVVRAPLVRDGRVYFVASYSQFRYSDGAIYALDAGTGAQRWVSQVVVNPGWPLVIAP